METTAVIDTIKVYVNYSTDGDCLLALIITMQSVVITPQKKQNSIDY